MEKIGFTVNNHKILGAISYPSEPKEVNPAILFVHGWTSGQNRFHTYMEELSKKGFICMSFDMEGHGKSEGNLELLKRSDFLNDVIAAYDYLSKVKGVNKKEINVVGSSFGSYLASILTSIRPIDKLVLRVPADYSDDGFNEIQLHQDHDQWRKKLHKPSESRALDSIHNFTGQVLIVESEKDEAVDQQTIKNYIHSVNDKSKVKHIVMKGAPHSINHINEFVQKFKSILVEYFK